MSGISGIFGNSISMMERSLDYLWTKQGVTSNNLANVDTPGYKAKYLNFEEAFRSKLYAAAHSGNQNQVQNAIRGAKSYVSVSTTESARLDGNNVNAEAEAVELTRTALQYQYGLNAVNSDIARLRSAIKGQ